MSEYLNTILFICCVALFVILIVAVPYPDEIPLEKQIQVVHVSSDVTCYVYKRELACLKN